MKVLSIDDSKAVHAFLTDILSKSKVQLDHAFDGKQGIEKVSQVSEPYQLILLDWEMPGMTGPEVLRDLRAKNVKTPVIMLTSKNDPNDIMKMLEGGASEYVMKPFTPEILVEKIECVLGSSIGIQKG